MGQGKLAEDAGPSPVYCKSRHLAGNSCTGSVGPSPKTEQSEQGRAELSPSNSVPPSSDE